MFPMAGSYRRRLRAAGGAAVVAGLVAAVILVRPAGPEATAAEPPAAAPAAGPAADLALVPADATGFVHVRLADLWKNDLFAGLRKTWERAGAKALATFDKQFAPAPSSLDRVTAFFLMDAETKQPQAFGVIAFSAPFDPAQLAKMYLPAAKKKQAAGKTVYVDEANGVAVTFPDNQHVLLGMPGAVEAYLARPVAKAGPMAGALKLAATGRPVVAALNIAGLPIPPGALDGVPEDVRPILKAEQLLISVDLGDHARLDVRATYPDAAAAGAAEEAVRALVALGRKELAKQVKELEGKLYDPAIKSPRPPEEFADAFGAVFGLGALGRVDDLLSDPKLIARDDKNLTFSAAMPKEIVAAAGGVAALGGLLVPAVAKVRAAAGNSTSQNNLKQIGLACHSYLDTMNKWPADITDKNGKPILSWRVAILPYIEQQALYQQFKLDEPWDSPTNKKASQMLVPTYRSPNEKQAEKSADGYGLTNYKGVSGPGAFFDPAAKKKLGIADITDGTSNTVLAVETGDPIPWAKPGDLPFDPEKPLPKIASPGLTDAFNALMCDGSVRRVDTKKTTEMTIKAAFTRNGGEVLGKDW